MAQKTTVVPDGKSPGQTGKARRTAASDGTGATKAGKTQRSASNGSPRGQAAKARAAATGSAATASVSTARSKASEATTRSRSEKQPAEGKPEKARKPSAARAEKARQTSAAEGEKARRSTPSARAAIARAEARKPSVTLPVVGRVTLPPPNRLAFYAALGVLTALEIIEWPIALVIGVGHFLAEQHVSRALQGVGQAAEAV
ncbi:hypothetical protein OG589_36925 [Sphaerisporangium sp. NBC_01403]|uniref:hypothetical protein n=1 Tax=Sphaerisporangium TaxID=321315 RepID=UPI00324953AA